MSFDTSIDGTDSSAEEAYNSILTDLIKFVYDNIKIDHVVDTSTNEGKGRVYYNRTNSWYDCPIPNEEACEGYRDCDFTDQVAPEGLVTYEFCYDAAGTGNELSFPTPRVMQNT